MTLNRGLVIPLRKKLCETVDNNVTNEAVTYCNNWHKNIQSYNPVTDKDQIGSERENTWNLVENLDDNHTLGDVDNRILNLFFWYDAVF